jgi:hypothetical protein
LNLSPHDFVFRRAKQIQDEILPEIEAAKSRLAEQELIFRTEMRVLEAAAGALPPDRVSMSEFADQEGGNE